MLSTQIFQLRKLVLTLTFIFVSGFVLGQMKQIRGTVVTEKGVPLPNVNIQTQNGINYTTNSKGQFVFNYDVPMKGEVPKFKFSRDGYSTFVWEYDREDNKQIVLHIKNYVIKTVSGVVLGKDGKIAPNVIIKTIDDKSVRTKSNERGEFRFKLKIPKPTTTETYDPRDLDKAKYGRRNVTFICNEYLDPITFSWDGDYSNFEVTLSVSANEKPKNNEVVQVTNKAPEIKLKDVESISEEIEDKHDELDTSSDLSNEKLKDLKDYIAYLETILETSDVTFDKSAMGQDSTIHRELKNKLLELKEKVKTKEKEVEAEKQKNFYLWIIIGIIVLILIPTTLAIIFYRNNKKTKKLNLVLDKQNKELKIAYHNIHSSVVYAQRIQQSILVKPEGIRQHFNDAFVFFRPKDIVSGDFYWFSNVDNKLIIAAVDCTGHGVPGAFMTMMGNSILNEIVNTRKITEPSEILSELHKKIQVALKTGGESKSNDGMDIVLCSVDATTRKVKFSGANNPLYFITNKEFKTIKGERNGLGGTKYDHDLIFTNHEIDVTEIDQFYLVSDGFQDQFGGKENRKYMKKRFKELLLQISEKPFDQQEAILENELNIWKGKNEQTDDILIIGVKV